MGWEKGSHRNKEFISFCGWKAYEQLQGTKQQLTEQKSVMVLVSYLYLATHLWKNATQ